MEHIDIDSEDKPVNPPKILSAKVIINIESITFVILGFDQSF